MVPVGGGGEVQWEALHLLIIKDKDQPELHVKVQSVPRNKHIPSRL
jgi:hypothetical protein